MLLGNSYRAQKAAGNFHAAICLGDQLLAQSDLPPRFRQRVREFTQILRQRRNQWPAWPWRPVPIDREASLVLSEGSRYNSD